MNKVSKILYLHGDVLDSTGNHLTLTAVGGTRYVQTKNNWKQ